MLYFIEIGKKIYNISNPREARRFVVFIIRCVLKYKRMEELKVFFHKNELMEKLANVYGFVYEQPTRAFFYNKSTFDERAKLLEQHFDFLQGKLDQETCIKLYRSENQVIWEDMYNGELLRLSLFFEPGQRKEGLLSLVLRLGDQQPLYQMIFWIAKDKNREWSFWIGAMQGPNMENANEIIKGITKCYFRYRTKNLILYMTMAVARSFDIEHIYAVSNEGYYANNHVRRDRKLKTDFGAFWEEAGGHVTDDPRFYEIPLIEPRKTMEEVPTRKRAVYRKRFAFLDGVDEKISDSMNRILKLCTSKQTSSNPRQRDVTS